jgi:hypothetical protein
MELRLLPMLKAVQVAHPYPIEIVMVKGRFFCACPQIDRLRRMVGRARIAHLIANFLRRAVRHTNLK